jgi:hypothetical protein
MVLEKNSRHPEGYKKAAFKYMLNRRDTTPLEQAEIKTDRTKDNKNNGSTKQLSEWHNEKMKERTGSQRRIQEKECG